MNDSEGSVNRIGRTIWTVWGYLSGAVARYLRPEVAHEANPKSSTDANRELEANYPEKDEGETKSDQNEQKTADVKCLLSEARVQVSAVQWEKNDAVKEDNKELHLETTVKQSYHCATWCAETKQVESFVDDAMNTSSGCKGEIITSDVVNYENKEKQTSEAHIEQEAAYFECEEEIKYTDSQDNTELKKETEQKLIEPEDVEQNDNCEKIVNEDVKEEEFDPFYEDGGEKCVIKRENSDGTEVTSRDVQSELVEQSNLINKDCGQTEDIRGTEHIRDLSREGVVKYVNEKEQIVVHMNQEEAENDEDNSTESLVNEADLLKLGCCSAEEEEDLIKPVKNEGLGVTETYLKNDYENEAVPTPETQVIDIISTNVVEVIETEGTTERDKNIEEHEQCMWLDTSELAGTDIFSEEEAHNQRLGEIQTSETESRNETKSELESAEALLGVLDDDIVEKNETCNKVGLETALVVNVGDETFDEFENTLQSDLPKQDSSKTGTVLPVVAITTEDMFSDLIVCDLPGELRKGPEIESVNTQPLDQITIVATTLGSFEEIETNLSKSHPPPEQQSHEETVVSCSVEVELKGTPNASLNVIVEEEIKLEQDSPIFSSESCTNQIQTLKKMAEVSLKECVQLRTEQVVETMKTEICSHEKAEVFVTESQANNETLELNTEKECILSQATVNTETLKIGHSSVTCEINRTELYAEDEPDVGDAKTALITSLNTGDVLRETPDLQSEHEISAEGLEPLEEPSTETLCDAEIQKPAECLPTGAVMLQTEKKLLHDTVESWVEMEVESVICDPVMKQKDEHDNSRPECELTEANGGCGQKEKNTVREKSFHSHDDMMAINKPVLKRTFDNVNKDLPEVKMEEQKVPAVDWSSTLDLYVQPFMDSSLDLSVQKYRIAVKNPLVRPPKDPKKLLHKTSVEPALPKSAPCGLLKGEQRVAVSVQSKGIIGFKLPGMGTELPTLRKTEFGKKAKEGEKVEGSIQEEKMSVEDTENSAQLKQVSLKPKWTPPKHPGMGSPLMMAELKSKLKTPVKE